MAISATGFAVGGVGADVETGCSWRLAEWDGCGDWLFLAVGGVGADTETTQKARTELVGDV